MTTLEGKKALILGGSRGIGAAIVERLAKEGPKQRSPMAARRQTLKH